MDQVKISKSVVIPVKDEKENIGPLTDQLIRVLNILATAKDEAFEILYVNDGSTDGSGELLDDLAKKHREIQILHFDKNYGQTAAFLAGFRRSRGKIIITMDGDLQEDPDDIATLLPLLEKYDLVCGWRKRRKDSLFRKFSSRMGYLSRRMITRDRIHDSGCSLKVFRREVVEQMPAFEGMHRFFPELARMQGFTVTEIPVRHFPRVHGRTKYGFSNRVFKVVSDLLAVRWMQKRFVRYRIKNHGD